MKKNLLLAACTALAVSQGLLAEPAAPVTVTSIGGIEEGDQIKAQICAMYADMTIGECSPIIPVTAEILKPIKLKIPGLKFDDIDSRGVDFHSYQLRILMGKMVKKVDQIPQGARISVGIFDGELGVGGNRLEGFSTWTFPRHKAKRMRKSRKPAEFQNLQTF